MANLLAVPSIYDEDAQVNLADWLELSALFSADHNTSREDLKKAIQREGNISDEVANDKVNEAFSELENRQLSCGETRGASNYPFDVSTDSALIRLRSSTSIPKHRSIYLFLLVLTQSDMSSTGRRRFGSDPTALFERLCGVVLRNFWGGASDFSGAIVFGTAAGTNGQARNFRANIEDLCRRLSEGDGWRAGAKSPGAGDGKLDVVAWRRFGDSRQGALVGFGQCKTGIHWEQHITKLTPATFSRKYMRTKLLLDPIRVYMVPNRISLHKWEEHTSDGGLLMDRCRIVQYGGDIPKEIRSECKTWLDAAIREQRTRNDAERPQ